MPADSKRATAFPPLLFRLLLTAFAIFLLTRLGAPSETPPAVAPPVVADAKRIAVAGHSTGPQRLGNIAVRSVLNVPAAMSYGDFVWDDEGVPPGTVSVRVDIAAQTLSVFRGGHEIGTAVILYGANEKPTPAGTFTILEKRKDHFSNLYHAPMPYMLRLTNDGIAIHGSEVREGAATHGCVGVPLEFARLLFEQVRIGDQVSLTAPPRRS
ncbi:MAG TPA: L,D-transpeptidase family protein [Allosphingosinicella sp.]|nr:L,D-transpeptidase family protein [Allosphingosinicella sp.]